MTDTTVDPWAAVVGHPDLVRRLRSAAEAPTHAYLFVGPQGVGTRAAARAFAGDLLAAGLDADGADRARVLCAAEHHPALVVTERVGASISADQARQIVRRAQMSPPEGSRQVLLLTEFHLVDRAAPILLKSIEEPPPGTVFVILADEVTPELVTIASRCVVFEFPPLARSVVRDQLVAEGASVDVAEAASISAGGDLDRARLLASDDRVVERRAFWASLPGRLDGTGARVAQLVSEILARIDEVLAPLAAHQEAEMARLAEQAEALGQRLVGVKDIEARHKREQKRIRTDELMAGLAGLMEGYRERAATDPLLGVSAFATAGELVAAFTDKLQYNPNEELALHALLLDLPTLSERT